MSKEVPIIRWRFEGDDAFPQTHVDGVIGLEDLVEALISQRLRQGLVVQAPTGQRFKVVVDDEGELSTERMEG